MDLQEIDQAIISLRLILSNLNNERRALTRNININNIKLSAEIACNLPSKSLNRKTNTRSIVLARQVVFYFLRQSTSLSLAEIGKCFGDEEWIPDHSTVSYGVSQVEKVLVDNTFDMKLYEVYKLIDEEITNSLK